MTVADIDQRINAKIESIKNIVHLLPGVIIIHRMPGGEIEYMSPNGLAQLNLTLEEVRSLSTEEYHNRYFNPDDAMDYVPKVLNWLDNSSDENLSFFQQVRVGINGAWVWHMSTLKIILRDDAGMPVLAVSISTKVEPMQHVTDKLERVLKENTFLRDNYHQYLTLTKRQREILRLIALGLSAPEIADKLFISVTTAETHRRNIKIKLKVNTSFELAEYARAFDLI